MSVQHFINLTAGQKEALAYALAEGISNAEYDGSVETVVLLRELQEPLL